MKRLSTGLSIAVIASTLACLTMLPNPTPSKETAFAMRKPDFSASGIDDMPVGTAKQIKRMRQARQ